MSGKKIAIVGSGFSGAAVAHVLAAAGGYTIDVFEEKDHIAGNCYTERDKASGIMVHKYGPHIFHTKRQDVWDFICKFTEMGAYTNRVKAHTARGVFSLPINLLTINQFFNKKMDPREARAFLESIGDKSIKEPQTFEEQALRFVGRDLYETFFKGYTIKQWGVDPKELPAAILQRLPIRFNYDDNYYADPHQGIPKNGYTEIIQQLLNHKCVSVHTKAMFPATDVQRYDHVFYSGSLDGFFNHAMGRLRYRTVEFERFDADGDFQGNTVINYCEESVPYTRITEHKHFTPWESHEKTVCFREFSTATRPTDVPFYPMRLADDKKLLEKYVSHAQSLNLNVTFMGRLGTYRYLDMDTCIGEALDCVKAFLNWNRGVAFPSFFIEPVSGKPAIF